MVERAVPLPFRLAARWRVGNGALAQLAGLADSFRASPYFRKILLIVGGIVAVVVGNAVAQVRLNVWQGAFYDALGRRDLAAFGDQLIVFGLLVTVLLGINVSQTWLTQRLKVRLRQGLTEDLLDQWLRPMRPFWLTFAGDISSNPDQRIQEDARRLTEVSADLAVGLLQSNLLLLSFIGVLWELSTQVAFVIHGRTWHIPGYMVWCALAYAATGSWLSWRFGRPLINLNAKRYGLEAEFRFALVRVSEHADGVVLYRGEADERQALEAAFRPVADMMKALVSALTRLTWITAGYGWVALVAPVILAAPGYFSGTLSLGGLMMVVGAFLQVQQSLRWFVDNFASIADWRAALLRVADFRAALTSLERVGQNAERIRIVDHPQGLLAFEDVSVQFDGSLSSLESGRIEIAAGERVRIAGEPRSGKTTLFRAIAGLWPWGRGTIYLPPHDQLMFISQRPYIPLGSLRNALAYPERIGSVTEQALVEALSRVGLGHLVAELDRKQRWDHELTLGEQQRLAFARLLLRRPQWVFLDDAVDTCEAEHHALILSIFERELPQAAVISVGSGPSGATDLYSRTLHLTRGSRTAAITVPAGGTAAPAPVVPQRPSG